MIFPFSSRILVIWVFSLLLFVSVVLVYQFCLFFQRTNFLFCQFFCIVSFVSILLISALILIISPLLQLLVLICFFSRTLSCNVGSFNCCLFLLLLNMIHAINFPLSTAFIVSQRFSYVVFLFSFTSKNFFISPLMSSGIHSSYNGVLFNFQVLE